MEKLIDDIIQAVLAALPPTATIWERRMSVAATFGYVDAKYMRYLHETHGLHIADQVCRIRTKCDLAIPWRTLHEEFAMLGMKPTAITAMLAEAREFDVAEA